MDITYLKLPLADNPGQVISSYFEPAFAMIDQAVASGGKVLAHCAGGGSRSAAMCVGYVVSRAPAGTKVDDVIERMQQVRPVVEPNWGFVEQLRTLEVPEK